MPLGMELDGVGSQGEAVRSVSLWESGPEAQPGSQPQEARPWQSTQRPGITAKEWAGYQADTRPRAECKSWGNQSEGSSVTV